MRGPRSRPAYTRELVAVCLHALLQERLGVRGVLGTLGGQVRLKRTVDELRRRIPTGIQIQRAHERLVNVLKRRVQAARAVPVSEAPKMMMSRYQLVRHLGQRGARDKGHLQARELALVKLGIGLEERTGHHAPKMESPKNSRRS